MIRLLINALFLFTLLIAMLSCGTKTRQQTESELDYTLLTKQQIESEQMKTGTISLKDFNETVSCNGYIVAPPNARAQISAVMPGRVKSIHIGIGQEVKKGQLLATIETPQLIELQMNYKKSKAQRRKVTADYQRIKALYEENIGTQKEFLAIESEYHTVEADFESYRLQLQMLKLNVEQIDRGEFYAHYPVYATIDGEITQVNCTLGDFTEDDVPIFEIVDLAQLQLSLSLFEKDLPFVKEDSEVEFRLASEDSQVHQASLKSIVSRIDPNSKVIEGRAAITSGSWRSFLPGAFVRATIINKQTQGWALPREAFVKRGEAYYVFVVKMQDEEGYQVKEQLVRVGRMANDYYEVPDANKDATYLVDGVYNLLVE